MQKFSCFGLPYYFREWHHNFLIYICKCGSQLNVWQSLVRISQATPESRRWKMERLRKRNIHSEKLWPVWPLWLVQGPQKATLVMSVIKSVQFYYFNVLCIFTAVHIITVFVCCSVLESKGKTDCHRQSKRNFCSVWSEAGREEICNGC